MLRPKSGLSQFVLREDFQITPYLAMTEFSDTYGNLCQRLVMPAGKVKLQSSIVAACADTIDVDFTAGWTPIVDLPDPILHFLLPSRYCESDKLSEEAKAITIGCNHGYEQVETIRRWIYTHFQYQYGVTDSRSSTLDVMATKTGVCRDFTHVGISLCRALDIPARMVTGYLLGLKPMDLHAWFEAYVGGRWYSFDATQAEPKGNRISMAYGRDAADVAFVTHFGNAELSRMTVDVKETSPSWL
ncbi:transglutaminase-like domain-containing protein [Parapedobacter koreensis]|nr:transglutaminase family protein [Parapedobacter koreensis]